jgi:ATP-dependent Lon protease
LSDLNGANELFSITNTFPDDTGMIELPVLPLRGLVIYPDVVMPASVNTAQALAAIEHAMHNRTTMIGIAQRDPRTDRIEAGVLFDTGTEIALGRMLRLPDGSHSVLIQGRRRVEIVELMQTDPFIVARARLLEPSLADDEGDVEELMDTVVNMFRRVIDLNEQLPDEVLFYALNATEPGWLADLITSTLTLPLEERQHILEIIAPMDRLRYVALLLNKELDVLELRDEINSQVQQEMDREQREVYLREQMRVIQSELGEDDIFQRELDEVREQIEAATLPSEVHDRAMKEYTRLLQMPPAAPEVSMVRTYIDWLVALPWSKESEDNLDIGNAQHVLDAQHYGLPKIKDRILEYIAVRKLAADKMHSPILCFVGPPGVGKTSLGKSIASALGREFVRVSLGGVRDEAEIRGHRRTYIGSLPGRILQTMRRAGTINPVFMLDEVDKLGMDFRGDPSSALLEVLDPEQNHAYSDHYLEISYDLSKVLFITTANDLDPLPPALLDRLEVIEFSGYTEEEKAGIARQFLIPQQLESHGLTNYHVRLDAPALKRLIREYTYEAGVRNLNREIANVYRKVARLVAEEKPYPRRITERHIERYLGPPPFDELRANDQDAVGVATGLAWTSFGGDILTIEVSILPGKGNLTMTGQLGDIMQESGQAALSFTRSQADTMDVPHDDFEEYDVHVHLPEGAVPKEGPSAGITLAAAIISAFTERPVRANFAMTGEITLRGRVLPVGGIKEKVLAARRARIPNVILPKQNEKDLVDVPKQALRDLNIHLVEHMQQVIDLVLLDPPPDGRQRDLNRQESEETETTGETA